MKKNYLLLTLVLSVFAMQANAQTVVNEGFENWGTTSVGDGWSLINSATYGNIYTYDYVVGSSDFTPNTGSKCLGNSSHSAAQGTTSSPMIVTPPMTGTFTFKYRKYNTSSSTKGYMNVFEYDETTGTATGSSVWTARPDYTNEATSKYQEGSITVGTKPKRYAIYLAKVSIDDLSFTGVDAADGPLLQVSIGDNVLVSGSTMTSMDEHPNGSGENTPKITISNPGVQTLSNISIAWTGNDASSFAVGNYPTSLDVNGSADVSLTLPETEGEYTATLKITGDDIDNFTFNVHLYVLDENKLHIEFDHDDLPEGWINSGWTINNGYARTRSYNTTATFKSGKVEASNNEMMVIKYRRNYTYSGYDTSLKVFALDAEDAAGTEVFSQTATDTQLQDWTISRFTVPATTKYLRIEGSYVDIQEFYGCTLPQEAIMKVESGGVGFGFLTNNSSTQTVNIRNAGTIDLTNLTATLDEASDEGFSIELDNSTVAPGQSTTLRITLGNEHKGNREAIINITADDQDPVQLSAQGYVADNTKILIAFDGNNPLPDSWTNTGWSIANGVATATYNTATMTSPKIEVNDGETMAIELKGTSSYSASLKVYTSADNTNWTVVGDFDTQARASTEAYTVVTFTPAAGTYYFKFEGKYVEVNHINGFNYDQNAPVMTVTDADNNVVSGTIDLALGKVSEIVETTYTVKNSGTGTLNVLIESSNTSDFTVDKEEMTLAAGESDTFTVSLDNRTYGAKSATITVISDNGELTINATATVPDPNVWDEDFEGGVLPMGWTATTWTVGKYSSYENKTYMALAPSSLTAGTITTPRLSANEGDVLTWDAYFQYYDEALIVEYSNDEQQTWNPIYNFKAEDDGITTFRPYYHKAMSFTAPADGKYYLRFTSTYSNGVDNFNGFKLDLPEHIMTITGSSIPTSGYYSPNMTEGVAFNATVTVKEDRGVAEENVVAKLYMDDEVIGTSDAESFAANQSKTIQIVCTPTKAATEGAQMHIEVEYAGGTLTTEPVTRYVKALNKLELTETEEKEITTGYSAVYDVVTLTRNFVRGWNTFVAPQSVAIEEFGDGAKVYEFTGYTDGQLQFNTVSSLNPATPYIIYLPEAMANKTFTWESPVIYSYYVGADNIKTTHNGVTFQGTYAPIAAPNMEGFYGVTADGYIKKGGAQASMKGFRAYFDMSGAAAAAEFTLSFDGIATGITTATIFDDVKGDIYDLQGRKVSKSQLRSGIYVVNGRKVVVK